MKKYAIALIITLLSFNSKAEATKWNMDPSGSKIDFKATQNNSPVTGSFDKFTADINFDKNNLKDSSVKITVDTGSVSASYDEVSTTLKTADWFSVDVFPKAV